MAAAREELLAATVADALGLSDHTSRMPLDAVCAWVAERPVLLVLDSCEHLVPQCRHLIERMLAACPGLRVLTTSREALGVAGETVLTVPPLETATDAVTLFAQRAEAVGAPVRDDAQQRLAARLCARLEGVPLALELAAAQLRHHGLAETTARARSGLDLPHAPPHRPGRTRRRDTRGTCWTPSAASATAFGLALGLELLAASWAERGAPRHAALAYGAGAQHWEIVGHHQRGTPEVAPLRKRGQAAARSRLGTTEYAALFERALRADRDHVVAWATTPDPAPHL
ncbi:hypothetical protein [Streptomyces reniochalinae]|uniref:NB-ARC domain-containing protein n=1 Tax=Streptomyces reniochalinae TaxID=2250578 RepID=A0A367EHK0_9ACTN|nr:hypothetical protein [Streptomyces reniochalinae]RCG17115.1 hypothetical protein DQ392_18905 [Streptomyces reniochalinae]